MVAVLILVAVILLGAFGCIPNDADEYAAHTQWEQQMKEDGEWVMW